MTDMIEKNPKNILLIGCGNLGQHLAAELQAEGHSVTATRRSLASLPAGLSGFALDVTRPETLSALNTHVWDAVVITLTARGEEAYRQVYVDGVRNVLTALSEVKQNPLVLFASSTSVYHQNDGSTVDETSATEPTGYSGKTMLAAERLLADSGLPHAAIRFSGIYGTYRSSANPVGESHASGGHLLKVMREGLISPAEPPRYSNRIHINDCVGVFKFLLQRHFEGQVLSPVYLASDGNPAPLNQVMELIAGLNDIDVEGLKPDYLPNRGGNKRCVGRLLAEQGYRMQVGDFRVGYGMG